MGLAEEILKARYPNGHPDFIPKLLRLVELHSSKNKGYAFGGEPLGNFYRVSIIKKLYPNMDWATPVGVCLGYSLKQLDCALWQLSQGYEDSGEPFSKRADDVVVYWVLAQILYEETINANR